MFFIRYVQSCYLFTTLCAVPCTVRCTCWYCVFFLLFYLHLKLTAIFSPIRSRPLNFLMEMQEIILQVQTDFLTLVFFNNGKVKCTLVQALRLSTGRTAHRGSRGIVLLFLTHSTRRGWDVSVTPRPLFTTGKDSVPVVQEAGWSPEPVWTGAENLVPTGFRSQDRLARTQSLYWLSYPVHSIL